MATGGSIPYGPNRQPWRETLSEVAISVADGKLVVSPPSADPLVRDSVVPDGITAASYQVISKGLTREEQDRPLEETKRAINKGRKSFLVSCPRNIFNVLGSFNPL